MPQISLNHGSAAVVLALCEIYKGGAMNVVEHYRALIEHQYHLGKDGRRKWGK